MGTLDDMMAADSAMMIGAGGPFSEEAVYITRQGVERTIDVECQRGSPATPEEMTRGIANVLLIVVGNRTSRGILASELDAANDKIRIAPMRGGETEDILLPWPSVQDAGRLVFRIGRGN